MSFVGVDGCRAGWVAVVWRGEGDEVEGHFLPTIGAVTTAVPDAEVIAIDAAAVAWTARRVAAGIADSFPAGAAAGDVAVWA